MIFFFALFGQMDPQICGGEPLSQSMNRAAGSVLHDLIFPENTKVQSDDDVQSNPDLMLDPVFDSDYFGAAAFASVWHKKDVFSAGSGAKACAGGSILAAGKREAGGSRYGKNGRRYFARCKDFNECLLALQKGIYRGRYHYFGSSGRLCD